MTDRDDLAHDFQAARTRLSAARAKLDEFGMGAHAVDSPPPDWSDSTHAGWTAALTEYRESEAEFTRLETQLKPQWAEESSHPIE